MDPRPTAPPQRPDDAVEPSYLAITGGTGKYREAQGELKVDQASDTEAPLTFKIID